MFNIFERIRRVPQQSGESYMKETQPKKNRKPAVPWNGIRLNRDWILLVCFSWRTEATEGPRVNFVTREALFEIYMWILCRFIPPWETNQTSRIQSLYLYFNYFIKIVPFWLRNIRFLIQNTRSLFYGRHYSSLHRLMSLHGKLNVTIFLMFIVAENTGSVNSFIW